LIVKKRLFVLATPLLLAGCFSGPGALHNKVHDWHQQNYEDDPLVTGILSSVIPVYPFIAAIAWIPDYLVLNTVQFWGTDVWDKQGATFKHVNTKKEKVAWYDK
jgi:hypothetical protein